MKTQSNTTVFLVDDNVLYLKALKNYLLENLKNINIYDFQTGEEMLNYKKSVPDIIILDFIFKIPNQKARNGLSILKRLGLKSPYIPVIILSGQKNKLIRTELINEGAYDYVEKFKNDFELVANDIRDISTQLIEKKLEDKVTLKITFWLIALSLMALAFLYFQNSL
ncbi:MAG: response regulator [Bacteroidia bacterium]